MEACREFSRSSMSTGSIHQFLPITAVTGQDVFFVGVGEKRRTMRFFFGGVGRKKSTMKTY